jgi:hypothetical protein
MAKSDWRHGIFRSAAGVVGAALMVSLISRTGSYRVFDQLKTVGWGLVLVIVLGGVAHLVRTLAWRLTFLYDVHDISFARTFGLRLASEAMGSFGLPGQILGESTRVYLLGSALPVANSISSVTLDRGLYIVTSALVCVTGILTALFLLSLSGTWRLWAFLFIGFLVRRIACSDRDGFSKMLARLLPCCAGDWECAVLQELVGWQAIRHRVRREKSVLLLP